LIFISFLLKEEQKNIFMKEGKLLWIYLLFPVFLFCHSATAQVPVRNEPHHKVVLENQYVRLIDVHLEPHDTTLAHIHAAPSVIVFLSKSTIGSQIVGALPNIAEVMPAQTSYAAYDEKPITHKVWDQGNSLYHVMDIELVKKDPAKDSCAALSQNGIALQWSQKLVRSYKIEITQDKPIAIPKSNCAYLLIDISGSVNIFSAKSDHSLQEGRYIFFTPQNDFKISGANAECVLLELK
jgi:hypothetical protein